MTAETTLQLAHAYDNIIAVKEASGDLVQVMHILKEKPPQFQVVSGDDALTLPLITLGGSGVISVIANAYPKEFSNAVNLALNNQLEKAREQHYRLLDMIDLLFSEGSPAGIKALLEILGKAKNNLRLPLVKVSDETYTQLKQLAANLH
jgi:4-hydroxy-tetrahydrodipicolinate synthase